VAATDPLKEFGAITTMGADASIAAIRLVALRA
jgi:hypothetical protein